MLWSAVAVAASHFRERDRGFESLFLQRGVSCEPDSQGPGFKRLVPRVHARSQTRHP
jgi:hypothetical protein